MMQDERKHVASEHSTTEQVRYKLGISKQMLNFLLTKLHSFTLVMITGGLGEGGGLFTAPGRAEINPKSIKLVTWRKIVVLGIKLDSQSS